MSSLFGYDGLGAVSPQILKAPYTHRLNSKRIGNEHLLLGLIHNDVFASAKVLSNFGTTLEALRKRVEALPPRIDLVSIPQLRQQVSGSLRQHRAPLTSLTVEIHGKKWNLEEVRSIVVRLKSQPYLWERKLWHVRDVVYEKHGKRFSFNTSLAKDESKFILVKGGWRKDFCAVCEWELFETDDAAHGMGYTNGKEWVCEECYQRFIDRDYFRSAYSDIT